MRVSVIVPVFNDETHLAQAVESVIAQTSGDWEVLIVDDGSTDGTRAVADRLAEVDSRITVVSPGRNIGIPAARNFAMAHARGELIALLDSDDYLREDFIERCVELFDGAEAAGSNPGVIACDAMVHGPDGVTGILWSERCGWCDDITLDRLVERNYVFARALVRREAIERVGGFSVECAVRFEGRYAAADDFDLWMRIAEAGWSIVTTREPLAYYRWPDMGRSRSPGVVALAYLRACERALDRGALDRHQRHVIRTHVRHNRALIRRGQVVDALGESRLRDAARVAPAAAVSGAVAFLQAPSRWGEWFGDLRPSRRPGSTPAQPARP